MISSNHFSSAETDVHLVIWNRLNERLNDSAILMANNLVSDDRIRHDVIVMLRPIGRELKYYQDLPAASSAGSLGREKKDYSMLQVDGGYRTSHGEMWIQVNPVSSELAWQFIEQWVQTNQCGQAWKALTNPVWAPFDSRASASNYLHAVNSELRSRIEELSDPTAAFLLKALWGNGTLVICEKLIQNGQLSRLDPRTDISLIRELLQEILSDTMSSDLKLDCDPFALDPSRLGVSHMPVFALNSVTCVNNSPADPVYQLHQYFSCGSSIYWPCCYSSKQEYLSTFS